MNSLMYISINITKVANLDSEHPKMLRTSYVYLFKVPSSWEFQILEGNLPIAFGWDKNGGRLSPAEDATLSIRSNDQYSSTLIIDRLQFGHRGNYTCTASNAAGSATFTAELTVNGACVLILPIVSRHGVF